MAPTRGSARLQTEAQQQTDDWRGSVSSTIMAMVGLDNMLRTPPFASGGLRRFQVQDDWEAARGEAPLAWPCFVISADQGPDAWCTQNWLADPAFGKLIVVREPDNRSHGVHNDILGSVMAFGLGGFCISQRSRATSTFCPEPAGRSARLPLPS